MSGSRVQRGCKQVDRGLQVVVHTLLDAQFAVDVA